MTDDPRANEGPNFYRTDANLQRLLRRIAPDLVDRQEQRLAGLGAWVAGEVDAAAAYTDRFAPPFLAIEDHDGSLTTRVICNPRYESAHRQAYERGMVGLNYGPSAEPYLLTFAMAYLLAQADIAIHCPVTLTGAVAYVLDRFAPHDLKHRYLPEVVRQDGKAWTGATWATERQGGSDMGAAQTTARAVGNAFELTGLKWFCSNAGADLALVTARPEGAPPGGKGLGLYLVPRAGPDGTLTRCRIRRLKEKLGTRGLPTGEVELLGACAHEVAPPPQGFRIMLEALEYSRVHNALAGAGVQRRAFIEALGHGATRRAFGATLISFPMVKDTLLDMLVELETSVALAFEAARAFDAAQKDPLRRSWLRTVTALAKHRTAEQAVCAASHAVEMLGGNGYTEEFVSSRLLRDAQVLTVWEGPANIQALELLRMMQREQGGFEAFAQRIEPVIDGMPAGLGDTAASLGAALSDCRHAVAHIREHAKEAPRHGRRLLDLMADTLCAALLLEEAGAEHARGDGRKSIIARRYLANRLGSPAQRGLAPTDDPAQRHFATLIGCEAVAGGT